MTDRDDYLLKCTLEAIEEGVRAEEIQEECACRLGFKEEKKPNLSPNKQGE